MSFTIRQFANKRVVAIGLTPPLPYAERFMLSSGLRRRGGEMADATDLKSVDRKVVWVRLPPSAPIQNQIVTGSQRSSANCPFLERFCPSDPRFPKFEEFALEVRESGGQWRCYARPKTKNAQHLSLLRGVAWSEQEAKDEVFRWYEKAAKKWKP